MKTLHADVTAALAADSFDFCYLVQIPGGLLFTDWGSNVTDSDGFVYTSTSLMTSIEHARSRDEISLNTYEITLSNVDRTISNAYRQQNYRGQSATVSLAIMSGSSTVVGTPFVIHKGSLDTFAIKETNSVSELSLTVTSNWASFEATSGRYTTDFSQKEVHPTDEFFKYAYRERSNLGWGT